MGIGRGGGDHHDGVVRAGPGERVGADAEVVADRHPDQVDVEVVGRLGERSVRALAGDDARPCDAALTADVACGLDRLEQALGAARGEVALDGAAGGRVVGAEQRGRVAHDVVLHGADAGEGQHVEAVLGAEERQRVGQQLVHVVTRRIDQAEDPAASPVLVALLHGQQAPHHFVAWQPLLGHRGVRERVHPAFLAQWRGSCAPGRTHEVRGDLRAHAPASPPRRPRRPTAWASNRPGCPSTSCCPWPWPGRPAPSFPHRPGLRHLGLGLGRAGRHRRGRRLAAGGVAAPFIRPDSHTYGAIGGPDLLLLGLACACINAVDGPHSGLA